MVTGQDILEFFRKELSLMTTITLNPIYLQLDTPLQNYAEYDELSDAIEKI